MGEIPTSGSGFDVPGSRINGTSATRPGQSMGFFGEFCRFWQNFSPWFHGEVDELIKNSLWKTIEKAKPWPSRNSGFSHIYLIFTHYIHMVDLKPSFFWMFTMFTRGHFLPDPGHDDNRERPGNQKNRRQDAERSSGSSRRFFRSQPYLDEPEAEAQVLWWLVNIEKTMENHHAIHG